MNKNETQPVTYKPFAIRSQHIEWVAKNCDSCKKGFNKKDHRFRCDWEWALCMALITGGMVVEGVAKAVGYLDNKDCIIWECPGWVKR